jgi:hypothetical protein
MRPLITLSQYQTLTNSATSTNDTLIETLLSSVTLEIENYCDRKFWVDTYLVWLNNWCYFYELYPKALPIKAISYYGESTTALTVTNTGTSPYTFNIKDEELTVTSNLTYTAHDLNTTLTNLVNTLTSAYNVTIVRDTTVTQNGLLLEPANYTILPSTAIEIKGSKQVEGDSKIIGNIIKCIAGCDIIGYVAGYTTIPNDLQLTTANIVKDVLGVQLGTNKAPYKSETITNYSYTLQDNISWYNIINNYAGQLATYKNIAF